MSRVAHDEYLSPKWPARRLFDHPKFQDAIVGATRWLEPTAGDGSIIVASGIPRSHWTACELQPKFEKRLRVVANEVHLGDFRRLARTPQLAKPRPGRKVQFDVALGNPPYAIAQQIIESSKKISSVVAMLLRIGFISSKEREEFFENDMPDIYVLPNRPGFVETENSKTDMSEYAWFVWDRNEYPLGKDVAYTYRLALTSLDERRER